jgi:predicted nucleic acid-binding protein
VDVPLIFQAIELSQRETVSFWDALIIRAGMESGCARLLSEDLQDGRRYGDTRIENPFLSA